jgi:hypothetical protein
VSSLTWNFITKVQIVYRTVPVLVHDFNMRWSVMIRNESCVEDEVGQDPLHFENFNLIVLAIKLTTGLLQYRVLTRRKFVITLLGNLQQVLQRYRSPTVKLLPARVILSATHTAVATPSLAFLRRGGHKHHVLV